MLGPRWKNILAKYKEGKKKYIPYASIQQSRYQEERREDQKLGTIERWRADLNLGMEMLRWHDGEKLAEGWQQLVDEVGNAEDIKNYTGES